MVVLLGRHCWTRCGRCCCCWRCCCGCRLRRRLAGEAAVVVIWRGRLIHIFTHIVVCVVSYQCSLIHTSTIHELSAEGRSGHTHTLTMKRPEYNLNRRFEFILCVCVFVLFGACRVHSVSLSLIYGWLYITNTQTQHVNGTQLPTRVSRSSSPVVSVPRI